MLPTGQLMVEHRLIERVIDDLRLRLQDVYSRKTLDPRYVDQVVDFLQTYADLCHHGKEENILFKALMVKGPNQALLKTMDELDAMHKFMRTSTKQVAAANQAYLAGVKGSEEQIRELLTHVAGHYMSHIQREDREFYAPAMDYFSSDEKTAMIVEMLNYDRGLIHEKYRRMADALEDDR